MITRFQNYLINEEKSQNTIKSYVQHVTGYLKWFEDSKGTTFNKLHRENIRDYISFLKTVKKGSPATINAKISCLIKFNEFLIDSGVQKEMVINKKDFIKVQKLYASLATLELKDVEKFRQMILEAESKRNYAIITLLAYCGLRISEALDISMKDFNLVSRELIVSEGKGSKTRTVFISDKVKDVLLGYLKERNEKKIESDFLFVSNRGERLDRSVINKLFSKYSKIIGKEITPHDLRHFFCSHAIESGMSVHEVANQAGHSNIHTTLLYTNPNKEKILNKMNKL